MALDRVTDAIPIELLSKIKEHTHNRKGAGGQVLYIVISGSDLYGFPSIDSDYDYRGSYIIDTNHLLGLNHPNQNIKMTIDEVEVELFELRKELGLALGMNCNVIEHLFAPAIYNTPTGIELRRMIGDMLSKTGLYKSYRGLSLFNYKKFILSGKKNTVKKYLYVYRGLLAGTYVLQTHRIEPNIENLAKYFDYQEVNDLIELKRTGTENLHMDITNLKLQQQIENRLNVAFAIMDASYSACTMQEAPTREQVQEVDDWLRRTRRNMLGNNIYVNF